MEVNTEYEEYVKFRIQVINEGGLIWYSDVVTYSFTCGPKSVNFTKPHPIMRFLDNDVNETIKQNKIENVPDETRFLFAPLKSPSPGCVITLT